MGFDTKDFEKEIELELSDFFGGEKFFKQATFDGYEITEWNKRAIEIVKNFESQKDNLYLWGGCGSGKTRLMNILAKMYLDKGARPRKDIRILRPMKLLRMFRGLEARDEERLYEELSCLPILMIDDLGVEKSTEFAISTLYEIISMREGKGRNGLVITSNFSLDGLASKIGDDRLSSRLAGMCKVVSIAGKDWRLKK